MGNVIHVDFGRKKKPVSGERELEKLEIFKQTLEHGVAMVVLDARREGVLVPSMFSQEMDLRLNFSYSYGIKDFGFDEQGVSATLSFSEGFFYCMVPWTSVFAILSSESNSHVVWPDDIPMELREK